MHPAASRFESVQQQGQDLAPGPSIQPWLGGELQLEAGQKNRQHDADALIARLRHREEQ